VAKEYHPHLLISDIKMPNKNGYDLVRELRQIPQFRLLPVIFLTNQDDTTARITGYQAGCDVYLAKPFNPNELVTIVRYLLERSQIVQSELLFTENNHNGKSSSISDSLKAETEIELTKREQEVLALIIEGFSNLKIAEKLYLSPKTIEKYVSNLLKKTTSRNRTELVSFAFKHNLV
jgi:DNA-binding NarL/FixJ family response regulator